MFRQSYAFYRAPELINLETMQYVPCTMLLEFLQFCPTAYEMNAKVVSAADDMLKFVAQSV